MQFSLSKNSNSLTTNIATTFPRVHPSTQTCLTKNHLGHLIRDFAMTPNRDGHTPFDILVVIASLFINETSSKKLFYKNSALCNPCSFR